MGACRFLRDCHILAVTLHPLLCPTRQQALDVFAVLLMQREFGISPSKLAGAISPPRSGLGSLSLAKS